MQDPDNRLSGFPLTVHYIDGRCWRLASNASYRTAAGLLSTVRTGFVFDWASVPRIFWHIFPPAGLRGQPYGIASMFHDWLYVHQRIAGRAITRLEADALFLEIMLYTGVNRHVAAILYRAVRIGGWYAWRRNADAIAPA